MLGVQNCLGHPVHGGFFHLFERKFELNSKIFICKQHDFVGVLNVYILFHVYILLSHVFFNNFSFNLNKMVTGCVFRSLFDLAHLFPKAAAHAMQDVLQKSQAKLSKKKHYPGLEEVST